MSCIDPKLIAKIRFPILKVHKPAIPYGLVVRIPAFHAGGPGSIPGVGGNFLILLGNIFIYNLIIKLHLDVHIC